MNLIDGKALAAKMQAELKVKVDKLKEADNVPVLPLFLWAKILRVKFMSEIKHDKPQQLV